METRSKDGSSRKLFMIMFSYLLPGIFLSYLLYKQNSDPGGFEYAFLSFLFFSLVIAFSIVSEFDNLLVSKTETDVFTSLPINDELIVYGKMYVFWRYVLVTTLPLLIPGSVFFYLILHSIPRALMYYVSGLMMCLFLVYFLLLIYSVAVRIFKSSRVSSYTIIFQIFLIFMLIVGYQFASFTFTGRQGPGLGNYMYTEKSRDFFNIFPQSWFGFIPAKHSYIADPIFILKMFLPFVLVYFSYLSLKMYLLQFYSIIKERNMMSRVVHNNSGSGTASFLGKGGFFDLIGSIYVRNNYEKASFSFMKSLYKRDKIVRLSILPMIAIPVGLAIFAFITNQIPSPFSFDYFETRPVFHISIFVSVLVVLNTGIRGTKVTNYIDASWVYDAYPLGSRKNFINGIRKFFVIYLLVPICVFLFIVFVFKMPFLYALVHTLYIFACANCFNSIFHMLNKDLPLTKENTLFNSLQRITSLIFPLLFGILFVTIQVFVYKNIFSAVIAVIAIFAVTFWINFFGFHRD